MTCPSQRADFAAEVIAPDTLRVRGELDYNAAPALLRAANTLCCKSRAEEHDLVLDLADLTFLGAAGLNVFVHLRMQVLEDGGRLLWQDVSRRFRRVFDLGGAGWLLDPHARPAWPAPDAPVVTTDCA